MSVRIFVADDHEIVRRGLRSILEAQPNWKVVGESEDGRDAVEQVKALKPDLVVLDISMPQLNGLEATRQIVSAVPRTQVLILTMHESDQLVHQVLDAGARGYILKSDAGKNLISAIEALLLNKPFFTPKISAMVLDGYLKGREGVEAGQSAHARLTPREREILQLLAEGKSNKEVAQALDIGLKTAETHRAHIMSKLNLSSVSQLVRYAVRNKIVEP